MKRLRFMGNIKHQRMAWLIPLALISFLMLFRLGSLADGFSPTERETFSDPVGFSGILDSALYLPLLVLRSIVFYLAPDHGLFLTRLPNALIGMVAIVSMIILIRRWHGTRTAALIGALFATGAWTLHASRLASFDVLYFVAIPVVLLLQLLLQKYGRRPIVFYGAPLVWGFLLYIPGMIWIVALSIFWQRRVLAAGWHHFKAWWQRLGYILACIVPLPFLGYSLTRSGEVMTWLGLPASWPEPFILLKQFAAVFVHLFVRGPEYPEIWLGQLPILDFFTLALCVIGIWFYATHRSATRSKILGSFMLIGAILVGMGGPVQLSLLVPLLYVFAAAGLTYLLQDWLRTFPSNPVARGVGICLVSLAVIISCAYNLRAYFVAWPHNPVQQATFDYRP